MPRHTAAPSTRHRHPNGRRWDERPPRAGSDSQATDTQMFALDVLATRLGLPVPLAISRRHADQLVRAWRDRVLALPAD